jgi:hypothetical protein
LTTGLGFVTFDPALSARDAAFGRAPIDHPFFSFSKLPFRVVFRGSKCRMHL